MLWHESIIKNKITFKFNLCCCSDKNNKKEKNNPTNISIPSKSNP